MTTQKPGGNLLVLVHPDSNDGIDTITAVVTGVNADGTVNAVAFPDRPGETVRELRDVRITSDRDAALAALGEHVSDLPHRRGEDKPTAIDAAPWVKVGYVPSDPRDAEIAELRGELSKLYSEVSAVKSQVASLRSAAAATSAPAKKTAAAKSAAAKSATAPAS